MTRLRLTPEMIDTIVHLYSQGYSSATIGELLGISERTVRHYTGKVKAKNEKLIISAIPQNITVNMLNGSVVVFSDAHIVPGELSVAAQGLLIVLEMVKPKIVVNGGDLVDFSSISRHDRLGWDEEYKLEDELNAGMEYLRQVYAKSLTAEHIYIEGNHDTRFNKFLAKHVPQFKGIKGMSLQDHIPKEWRYSISMLLNDNTMFLHGWHGGIHSSYQNTLKAGMNTVHGHTHQLEIKPFTDYNGTRYGISTGTLATIKDNKLFAYTNASPLNWIAGFVVLTYKDGRLLFPEVASVEKDGHLYFRGKLII